MTTVPHALVMLEGQICPGCGSSTSVEIEDASVGLAAEVCTNGHRWPYERFTAEHDTNAFEGDFDPFAIAEVLEGSGWLS